MTAAFREVRVPAIVAGAAPLAKAGLGAAIGKAVLVGVPAVLVGVGLGYALSRAFDVRWDEFSRRAADGDATMMRSPRKAPS